MVLLHVLRLVSVVVLWFVLPAVGFALLPAVGFALLGSFHHRSRSSMFFSLSSYPGCFTSFFSPLVSLAVVPFLILSPLALFAVDPSVLL